MQVLKCSEAWILVGPRLPEVSAVSANEVRIGWNLNVLMKSEMGGT